MVSSSKVLLKEIGAVLHFVAEFGCCLNSHNIRSYHIYPYNVHSFYPQKWV
jgi:hypothetical protein